MTRRAPWPKHAQMISQTELAKRLKDARERLGLTKQEVERRVGIGRNVLATYENGRTPPPLQSLLELCALYEILPGKILDPEPVAGESDDAIASALSAQPGLRDLVLKMIRNPNVYAQVREWISVVESLQKEAASGG